MREEDADLERDDPERPAASLAPAYFDRLYAADADPWGFCVSDYERDKYAATLAALPRERYAQGVEVGCSIGVLSGRLADRCDRLLGIDVAERALETARLHNAGRANVAFERRLMPSEAPAGGFDLIVLSEVLYYFDAADLARMAAWVETALNPAGDLVLVHWLGETPDYPLTGDAAAEGFLAAVDGFTRVLQRRREPRYRLETLRRTNAS